MSSMNQSTVQSRAVITTTDRLINTSTKKLAGKKKIDEDVSLFVNHSDAAAGYLDRYREKNRVKPFTTEKNRRVICTGPCFFILPRSVDPLAAIIN